MSRLPVFEEYDSPDQEAESKEACCENVVCIGHTSKAIEVLFDTGHTAWIPQSQIHDDSEVYAEDTSGMLVVSRWLAHERGWI